MKIDKKAAVAMMAELGFPTAEKWNDARLLKKLEALPTSLGPNDACSDEANAQLLEGILTALEKDEALEIEGAAPSTEEKPADTSKPKAVRDKEAKTKEKAETKAKEPKAPTDNRGYAAGVAIARTLGLEYASKDKTKIDAAVALTNELQGKPNDVESNFRVRSGQASIDGYLAELGAQGYTVSILKKA